MEEIRKDLTNLIEDINNHIVEKEETWLIKPLKYRLEIIESKIERIPINNSSKEREERDKINADLTSVRALLV